MGVSKSKFISTVQRRGSYTIIPNELFRASELDVYDKIVFSHIVSQAPNWSASIGNISRNLHINEKIVSKRIENLQQHNLIDWKQTKGKYAQVEIKPPNEWGISYRTTASSNAGTGTGCSIGRVWDTGHIIRN